MSIAFYKYQGTGNDFIMINAMENPAVLSLSKDKIEMLCDRRFGIGADGLILLAPSDQADFKMVYFNSDGGESTMCGNGGRCIAQFAYDQKKVSTHMEFEAIDGMHKAVVKDSNDVELQMIDVNECHQLDSQTYRVHTGSPHYVHFSKDYDTIDIVQFGKEIRYSEEYAKEGINVNVSTYENGTLLVKTYERGVEDETFSCGTGVTAAALCASTHMDVDPEEMKVSSKGGMLRIKFEKEADGFKNIWLCGPARFVFKGQINLPD